MNARHDTGNGTKGKLRARVAALGFALAVAAAGGIVGVVGAGPAAAVPISLKLNYTCNFPVINNQPVVVKLNTDMATSHKVGQPTPNYVINAVATVDSDTTGSLNVISAKTIEGTVDGTARLDAPQSDSDRTVTFNVTKTSIPPSGAFGIGATGFAPSFTFTRPGHGMVTIDDLVLHLVARTADGNQVGQGRYDIPCTLDANQNNVLLRFDITGAGPTTHPTHPGPTVPPLSGSSGPTTGTPTGTPSDASASASTTGTSSVTPSVTMSGDTTSGTTGSTGGGLTPIASKKGLSTVDLVLLIVGSLVVGGGAYHFGSRLLSRRRADGGS